jgi:isopenicillin N synthase-like dioxygenase
MSSIPTIDFGPFLKEEGVVVGDPPTGAQSSVARAVDAACRDHGFIHLINFGLTDSLKQQVFQASAQLFHMDEEHKKTLCRIKPSTNTGYSPFQTESLNQNRPPELKEAFNIRFPPAVENDYIGCPDTFQVAADALQAVLEKAAHRYALACALALGLPVDFFLKTLQEMSLCTIRFLHYPPCEFGATSIEQINMPTRIGEHTDFGCYTFLLLGEHGAEGLQIKPIEGGEIGGLSGGEEGGWIDVVVPPNGAIINTGALMARWTNDEWRATAHRVIVPSELVAGRERFSIAFFVDPDKDAMVEVHDKFCRDGKPKRYEPITSSDYLTSKLQEMMSPKTKT